MEKNCSFVLFKEQKLNFLMYWKFRIFPSKKKIEKQKREKGKTFFSTLFGNIKVNKNEICQISI